MSEDRPTTLPEEIQRLLAAGDTIYPASLSERFGVDEAEVENIVESERSRLAGLPRLGNYQLLDEIGHGAGGVVFRARDRVLGRAVAVKTLPDFVAQKSGAVERFRREASAMARLRHPNLVPLYDFGIDSGHWYFAMELVEGESLADEIARRRRVDREPAPGREEIVRLLLGHAGVAEALHAAHAEGIIHRDVKPSNILIDRDGRFRLTDFGLAKEFGGESLTLSGAMAGTPLYMSPEQAKGTRVDARSDVYSLGLTLYEALTLRSPFVGRELPHLLHQVIHDDPIAPRRLGIRLPREIEAILARATEKSPSRRYANARELADDLRAFVEYRRVRARPPGPLAAARKAIRRHRTPLLAAVTSVLLVAALALGPGLARGVQRWLREASAARTAAERETKARTDLERARARATTERISALRQFVAEYADTPAVAEGYRSLGNELERAGERDRAIEAMAESFLRDPEGPAGTMALFALARQAHFANRSRQALRMVDWLLPRIGHGALARKTLLLGAEASLALGDRGDARWYLDEATRLRSARADETDARIAEVASVLRSCAPASEYRIECSEGTLVSAGTFRPGERGLLVLRAGRQPMLLRSEGGRLEEAELPPCPPVAPQDPRAAPFVDEDGEVALLYVSGGRRGPWDLTRIDFGRGEVTRVWSGLPEAQYEILRDDVSGDGIGDLILGMSWPHRGVIFLRGREDGGFEEALPGDLAEIAGDFDRVAENAEEGSDTRGLSTAPTPGGGPRTLIVVAAEHEQYSIVFYRYDPGIGTFRRTAEVPIGIGDRLLPIPGPASAAPQFLFGLRGTPYASAEPLLDRFLPIGIHRLVLDGTGRASILPVEDMGRIAGLQPGEGLPPLLRFSCAPLALTSDPAHPGLLSITKVADARGPSTSRLEFHPRLEQSAPGIVVPAGAGVLGGTLGDLFATDGEETIVVSGEGLRVLARGADPAPVEPRNRSILRSGRGGRSADLRVEAGEFILDFGLARRAMDVFRTAWAEAPAGEYARRCINGFADAGLAARRADECLSFLAGAASATTGHASTIRVAQARAMEELGDFAGAAEAWREVLDLPGVDRANRGVAREQLSRLEEWARSGELPLPPLSEWAKSANEYADRRPPEGAAANGSIARVRRLGSGVLWSGESFQLTFELTLDRLDGGHGLLVGFVGPLVSEGKSAGAYLEASSTSSAPRSVAIHWRTSSDCRADCWRWEGNQFQPGLTYRVQLSFSRPLGSFRLIVRDATTGEFFAGCSLSGLPDMTGLPLEICIDRVSYATDEPLVTVGQLRLFRPR